MKALVAADAHLFRLPDGSYWCKSVYDYMFWCRYLNTFEEIRVVSRVKHIEELDGEYLRADGPGVEFFEVPFFQGPVQLLKKYFSINKKLKGAFAGCDCAIYRLPSQTVEMTYVHRNKKIPYIGEIVYCQRDSIVGAQFSLYKILNMITSYRMKRFCKNANGISYVTKEAIQKYYPSHAHLHGESEEYFTTYYSSITLGNEAFSEARDFQSQKEYLLVLTDDAMNGERKGERTLLHVVKNVRNKGYNVQAVLVGDGSKRGEFESLAKELGIEQFVHFTGRLSSAAEVREELGRGDIYVLPTQGEGLPRGIIEAMAQGMPVLSTPVGGIPELIEDKYLFDPGDVQGFSDMLCYLLEHPEELNHMSSNNIRIASEYRNEILQSRRDEFYKKLKVLVNTK